MAKQKVSFEDELEGFLDELEKREHLQEFKSERVAEIHEFIERKDPFRHPELYIARQIKGLTDFKRLITLALISPLRPIHVIAVGDPSVGKSEVGLSFQEVSPRVTFSWGSKLTAAGLTLARLGNRLQVGVLPNSHMGLGIVDEFNLLPPEDGAAILSTMQHQYFGIDKAYLKVPYVPAKCSIIAMANPSGGGYWLSASPHQVRKQMPFSSMALLTRFHFVLVMLRPTVEEFGEISAHQLRYQAGSRKSIRFSDSEKELWRDAVLYLRHLRPDWGSHKRLKRRIISAFTTEAYQEERHNKVAIPVSPRLNEGASHLAEAFAKAGLHGSVWIGDTMKAVQLMANSLIPCGLDMARVKRRIAEALNAEKNK